MTVGGLTLLEKLLPRQADNGYHGHRVGLWVLGALVFMKTAIGVNSIASGYRVASGADGIPLETFPPAASSAVVSLFGLLGVSGLAVCSLCVLVLARYRSLTPFIFAFLLAEYLAKRVELRAHPIVSTASPPGDIVSLVLLSLTVIGLALSLWDRSK